MVNLRQTNFTKEEMKLLEFRPNYALEKPVKHYTEDSVIANENAINNLEVKSRNTYRFLAFNKIRLCTQTKHM
jgi:hypothetical protein